LTDWIERCDLPVPGSRDLAWNSFVLATRISWWIRSWLALKSAGESLPPELETRLLRGLWRQAAYLEGHVEWDLCANHLLRDAVGLAWAGRFFKDERAEKWMRLATEIAVEQAKEQVLADGGHFERSPMYHVHVMEDVLSLALLLEEPQAVSALKDTWLKMAGFLTWMRHPDRGIPLFNDAALEAVCDPDDMLGLAGLAGTEIDRDIPSGLRHFTDTGMVVWHGDPWTVFFDVGPVGPDYQPGHAHADTLSIECSFKGKRIFVDPGAYNYDANERRAYDRSTDAHNTVCVDGRDSSEVWHIFRVGRRAKPMEVTADLSNGEPAAFAAHDGYCRLSGGPRHSRKINVSGDGRLTVADTVEGKGRHVLSGGLLLAPEWKAEPAPAGFELSNGAERVRVAIEGPEGLKLLSETRRYHPQYGLEQETARLAWRMETQLPAVVRTHANKV
jgi:uncharacterized heparinase superfamily protein